MGSFLNRFLELIEIASDNVPIIRASGTIGENSTAANYQTITAAKISLTFIDYPPTPVPTTFALVPPTGQSGVVPSALAPSDVQLYAFDNQENIAARAPVSVFISAGAVSRGVCTGGSVNETCKRRVIFLVYTSSLFFQEEQAPTEETAQSASSTPTTVKANSLILSIKLGTLRRVQLSEPVVITFTPIVTSSRSEDHICVFWDYAKNSQWWGEVLFPELLIFILFSLFTFRVHLSQS